MNPETGLCLRDDPALAWVTLAGETSIFDLIDSPDSLPPEEAAILKGFVQKSSQGSGRRAWVGIEANQWRSIADSLRKSGLKAPIAGCSHWRRESEFDQAEAAAGLDLIDDRLYWMSPIFGAPERRSMAWRQTTSIAVEAAKKRKTDRPYVAGEFADHTEGAWASPFEGADLLVAARTAAVEDWDGLVRRGVFLAPNPWGAGPPGTTGPLDLFVMPEALNANPQVFALLPHAASLLLRSADSLKSSGSRKGGSTWDSAHGRLLIDTPFTQGIAGWPGKRPASLDAVSIDVENPYAVVMVSSVGPEPIARARRLLITAISRAEPTGLTYADQWKRQIANPGRPPILIEPVRARITLKRKGSFRAFALDETGKRGPKAELKSSPEGSILEIEADSPAIHWEILE